MEVETAAFGEAPDGGFPGEIGECAEEGGDSEQESAAESSTALRGGIIYSLLGHSVSILDSPAQD
ncbi:MAG TPA: hypothetical protein P5568_13885, partial [Acidobacteriota bacterium]|nr:hypothetical protein [Acidobacteriota bacterium]